MLKVAITGNIASGKSAVEDILKSKMYSVIDTDEVTHSLLENDRIIKSLQKIFKDFDILEDNKISRAKLGRIVFANYPLRKKLENVLHPKIKKEIENFFCIQEVQGENVVFVAIPLLYEAHFEKLFDKTLLIYTKDKIRLQRLMTRNNLDMQEAQNRINSQISQDKKLSLADYVIYNNTTLEELNTSVQDFILHL